VTCHYALTCLRTGHYGSPHVDRSPR
jgi:hypothetical protein